MINGMSNTTVNGNEKTLRFGNGLRGVPALSSGASGSNTNQVP